MTVFSMFLIWPEHSVLHAQQLAILIFNVILNLAFLYKLNFFDKLFIVTAGIFKAIEKESL